MSRKRIELQLISLTKQIASIEARQLDACYASATDRPHEDFDMLLSQKDRLVTRKLELQAQLAAKPTFIQLITGGRKK